MIVASRAFAEAKSIQPAARLVAYGIAAVEPGLFGLGPVPAVRKALERDPNAPVLGNPRGDITLTEFFDYNCPFCKKIMPKMQLILDSSGAKTHRLKRTPVASTSESARGIWSPMHDDLPQH